jgi:hypothetical protein
VEANWRAAGVVVEPEALAGQGCVPTSTVSLWIDRLRRVGEPITESVGSRGLWLVVQANGSSEKGTPMNYIGHIAPVPAAGSPAERHASAAGPRPTGTDRLLPAWAMGTWLVR